MQFQIIYESLLWFNNILITFQIIYHTKIFIFWILKKKSKEANIEITHELVKEHIDENLIDTDYIINERPTVLNTIYELRAHEALIKWRRYERDLYEIKKSIEGDNRCWNTKQGKEFDKLYNISLIYQFEKDAENACKEAVFFARKAGLFDDKDELYKEYWIRHQTCKPGL